MALGGLASAVGARLRGETRPQASARADAARSRPQPSARADGQASPERAHGASCGQRREPTRELWHSMAARGDATRRKWARGRLWAWRPRLGTGTGWQSTSSTTECGSPSRTSWRRRANGRRRRSRRFGRPSASRPSATQPGRRPAARRVRAAPRAGAVPSRPQSWARSSDTGSSTKSALPSAVRIPMPC